MGVQSSTAVAVDFRLTLQEAIEAAAQQAENRPPGADDPEGDDDPRCRPRVLRGGGPSTAPHPVSLITGNVFLGQEDIRFPGLRHDFVFTRSYNSLAGPAGAMGTGWNAWYEKRIEEVSPYILRLWGSDGAPDYYTDPDGNGIFAEFGKSYPESTIQRMTDDYRSFRSGASEGYRADGRLLNRSDRTARSTQLVYETSSDRVSEIVSPEGWKLTLEYNGDGTLRSLAGPAGVVAEYRYNTQYNQLGSVSRLSQVRYADGTGYRFTYNDAHQLLNVSDLAGIVLDRHGYSGDKAAWSELNGGQERYTYTYEADRATVSHAGGGVSIVEWAQKKSGRYVTKVTGCSFCGTQSGTQTWEVDDDGRVTKYSDAEDKPTTFRWEGENLVEMIDALGRLTTYGDHDEYGRPRTVTAQGWGTTTLGYAAEGVQSVQPPGVLATTYTYLNNRLQSVRTGGGLTYNLVINDLGEVESITNSRNKTTSFGYDALGRLRTVTNPNSVTVTINRDARGRPLEILRPDGKKATFSYDGSGRLRSVVNAAGRSSSYSYDRFGRPLAVLDPLGRSTRLAYDDMSLVREITDANGHATTLEYDEVGRLRKMTDPMQGVEEYTYYLNGLLKTVTDRSNVTRTYAYDDLGRPKGVTYAGVTPPTAATPPLTVDYDDAVRRVTLSNGTDTVALTYDEAGRLVRETSSLNGGTTTYTYNNDNQLETVSLDGSLIWRNVYVDGYLDRIDFAFRSIGFGYDDLGRRESLTYPNGVETAYTYNYQLGWLEEVEFIRDTTILETFSYAHDDVGNRVTKETSDWLERYSYDDVDRLTGIARTGNGSGSWSFGYDGVGNRTTEQINGNARQLEYDARNRLLDAEAGGPLRVAGTTTEPASVKVDGQPAKMLGGNAFEGQVQATESPAYFTVEAKDASDNTRTKTYRVQLVGNATYTHDANGNLASRVDASGTWTYEWNARNQLVRALKDGTEVARFGYDPLGRRVEKVAAGVTTRYIYAREDILREVRTDGGGASTFTYIHGPGIDEPLARQDTTGDLTYYHADGLGSIVKVTDDAGAVTLTRQYDAWGNVEQGSTTPGYAFTGREWDPETGLYYYRARYYDAKVGRFVSEDPIRFLGGVNSYAYVSGRPTLLVDPAGLEAGNINEMVPGPGPVSLSPWSTDPLGPSNIGIPPIDALVTLQNYYQNMKDAWTIGADPYFHCLGMCEASRKGRGAALTAGLAGEARELRDQFIKGDPEWACDEDRTANDTGINGDRAVPCQAICAPFRPPYLDPKY